MKTTFTVTKFTQTGIETYKDVKISRTFGDEDTLGKIKEWAKKAMGDTKTPKHNISLASLDISDSQ